MIGGLVGGVLVAAVGSGWAIGIDAISYLVSVVFLLRMQSVRSSLEVRAPGFFADLRAGWVAFRSRTWLWTMVLGVAVFLMTVQAPFYVLGPVITEASYSGARTWGFLAAALGVGQIAGAAVAMRWEPKRPLVVVAGSLWLAGLPALLLGVGVAVWLLLVSGVVLGVVWGLIHPVWVTTLQRQIPPAVLSRVASYDYLGSLLAYPTALAVVGPIADRAGASNVLLAAAGCAVLVSLTLISAAPVRRLRSAAPEPAPETPQATA